MDTLSLKGTTKRAFSQLPAQDRIQFRPLALAVNRA
jgi:hypothetical protein